MKDTQLKDADDLNQKVRSIWNTNAEWWDDRIGDGNGFQEQLIEPHTERLLELNPGIRILDIACGAGRLSRRMASLGVHVTAFDFSKRFIARAKSRTGANLTVNYHVADATDPDQILALCPELQDRAVCTMALMDMVQIDPLFDALARCLKLGGHFVFSVLHPSFHSNKPTWFAEREELDSGPNDVTGVKVARYLTAFAYRGEGIRGQPERQYYFHRPLETLVSAGLRSGFLVSGLVEPRLQPGRPKGPLSWDSMPDIPPILLMRMTLLREPQDSLNS